MPNVITDIVVHPPSDLKGANIPYRGLEWHSPAKPDYLLYIFNISARTFEDSAGRGIIGAVTRLRAPGVVAGDPTAVTLPDGSVAPGSPTQPYHYVTSFPQPMLLHKFNDESNEIEVKETDARRYVVDMISPDNLTYSLDATIDPAKAFSVGNDYAPRGIFFSYSNPPAQVDLQKAYARMETYYKGLNEKAATLELTDKLGLQNAIQSNPDHVYAANYYGKVFPWAKREVRPVECPNCGEQKPAGRLFHQTSFGSICIEQSAEGWRSAVNSGIKNYRDVPEEFRWRNKKDEDEAAAGQ